MANTVYVNVDIDSYDCWLKYWAGIWILWLVHFSNTISKKITVPLLTAAAGIGRNCKLNSRRARHNLWLKPEA
jgi:hypothetical protein